MRKTVVVPALKEEYGKVLACGIHTVQVYIVQCVQCVLYTPININILVGSYCLHLKRL